jgi:hypothetical protein
VWMRCASGSPPTLGHAGALRSSERTAAIRSTAGARVVRLGGPIARLRPTRKEDTVQVLWWRRETWAPPGDFGPLILPLDKALDFAATEGFFWINA